MSANKKETTDGAVEEARGIVIESKLFFEKIDRLYSQWNSHEELSKADALLVIVGKSSREDIQRKFSEVFHLWLIEYVFTETIILFTKRKIYFFATSRKKPYFEKILEPAQYSGPKIVTIERDTKKEIDPQLQELFKELRENKSSPMIASFLNDQLVGTFAEKSSSFVKAHMGQMDLAPFFDKTIQVKSPGEIDLIKKCGKILVFLFTKTISLLEQIIDDEEKKSHQSISEEILQYLMDANASKFYLSNKIEKDVMEVNRIPVIQSGGVYSLDAVHPDSRVISPDVVLITQWVKYRNYLCTISRTLLIDATEDQKKAYQAVLGCFQQCIASMTVGNKLSQVYSKGKEYLAGASPALVQFLPRSFGHGLGCKDEEKSLEITETNHTTIVPGMAFELKIGLQGMENQKMKYAILLSDTVIITSDPRQREIVTGAITKAYKDISYSISVEEEVKHNSSQTGRRGEDQKNADRISISAANNATPIWNEERKLRAKENPHNIEKEQKRKMHQKELHAQKIEELKAKFSSNEIITSKKSSNLKSLKMEELLSYDSPTQFPLEAKATGIHVDLKRESILLPVFGRLVPFHVSTIKNVSKTTDESTNNSFLRINFHIPGTGAAFNSPIGFPERSGVNFAFLKELTVKCGSIKSLSDSHRLIKELSKRVKTKGQEQKDKEGLVTQKTLLTIKGKHPALNDVSIRPNISGKKTNGILEGHTNGLRFTSSKGERIDIIYENIKHAFYQPCENELIVLVHFNLHNPIIVGGKKANDLQFYSDVGLAADDLDQRRRNMTDNDELEQEHRERQIKIKLNTEYKKFAEQVEALSKIEFDIPYRELGFYGVPSRANVFLVPTLNCLVNLSEFPFFVVSLSDVDHVHFERVNFSLKNFDMVFIFHDLTTFVLIRSIPADSLEPIKDWLNELNLTYTEGPINLNWSNLLAKIREDPQSFVNERAWGFLKMDSESEEGDKEDNAVGDPDSSFEPEGSESEYSDNDSSEYSEDESGEEEDDELEEEGLSWDELERQAARQDRRIETKHGKEDDNPQPKKRTRKDD